VTLAPVPGHGRSSKPDSDWVDVIATERRRACVTHTELIAARKERLSAWPDLTHPALIEALARQGINAPWSHQADAATLAMQGTSVITATGTASGKSLSYWIPAVSALLEGGPNGTATVLHLAPTKALAADQALALGAFAPPEVRVGVFDGDTSQDDRAWVRRHANYVMTNPDMLHHGILPNHVRWQRFLRGLAFVVVDETHAYRGVFGAHVASVLRRLVRLCNRYGSDPVFLMASATMSAPEVTASRLTGRDVVAITDDGSPSAGRTFVLWEPPPIVTEPAPDARGDGHPDDLLDDVVDLPPVRRSATSEAADLLTDLVVAGARTLTFVRSRRGVEAVATSAKASLAEVDPAAVDEVAAYRGGYLPEERRDLERRLRSGDLRGLATTNALELGIDVSGLDCVLMAGWPGTRASVMQQAGRAGRDGQSSLAVLIARDDPLDHYVVHHPEVLFERPVEQSVFDPDNPYVLAPHLCAAAAEAPLTEEGPEGIDAFGPRARQVAETLVAQGVLRRRRDGWYWTSRDRATDLADLRGTGGAPVRIVEESTGRLLGTVDASSSHRLVHPGAVYVHQGVEHLVTGLDEDDRVAMVREAVLDHTTHARSVTQVEIVESVRDQAWGQATLSTGFVDVTTQVVAFARRRKGSGELLGEEPLDLPPRTLRTASVWWTLSAEQVEGSGVASIDIPGAAHAAEHASIGLLPLLATCDRGDLGGLSTAMHADTGRLTVFVHDAVPGGAGFAEQGYLTAPTWLNMTRTAISECGCASGCPSCVQSPKCGNGNEPLDKAGAIALLDVLLAGAPTMSEAAD
jgi:DEAD/DEAH box helicase domain-containing protein